MSMAKSPADRMYTKTHEWVKIDGQVATVGISDHAQHALGDITFVELPKIGKKLTKGQSCATVESVKAASDIYAPVSGEIAEVNNAICTTPEDLNKSPFDKAWLFKIKNFSANDTADLLNATDYDAHAESEA